MDFQKAAIKLKERGNEHFKKNEISEAIKCYQQAFEHDEDAFFKTNMALCYIKLKQYEKAVDECKTAIKLSPKLVKAHYLLGESYLNCMDYEQAEKSYLKAEVLAKELNNTSKSILLNIYKGVDRSRARRYERQEQERQSVVVELRNYVDKIMNNFENTGMVKSSSEREDFNLKKFQLESFFEQNLHPHKETEVPEVLCCKITYTIMRDPVITTSGVTYERSAIEKHLREKSFDPVTRQPCTLSQLYPNLAVKEMVESWIKKHPYTITEDHYYMMD